MINNDEIQFIIGNIEDYEFYYDLKCEESNIYWSGYKYKPTYEKLKQWYIDKVINNGIEFRFIEYNNVKVGALYYKLEDSICKYLGLAVSEKFSGNGIAKATVEKFINEIKNLNCKKIQFFIRTDNLASIKIHEKLGCKRSGHTEYLYIESEDRDVLMEEWELYI